VQRFARRWWAGDAGLLGAMLSVALTPLSWLWSAVTSLRNRSHDRRAGAAVDGVSVVSVGNLAVGGTGKTPVASWVARSIAEAGGRPALVLRGYGRDEALLHGSWTPGVPVIVDADRVSGVRRARAGGVDVAVLDDGFQHRALARDLDIVLLAVEDRFPGRVLPCGPYREPARSLLRADAVLITRRLGTVGDARRLEETVLGLDGLAAGPVTASLRLAPGRVRALGGEGVPGGLEDPLVVTAVARPDVFLRDVESLCEGSPELFAFSDHHDYTAGDARRVRARAGARPIVVTEKDAVKLADFHDLVGDWWVVGQRLEWDWGEQEVKQLLAGLVPSEAA
jgi:tetraacyldisaccharide 4'-kinase